MAPVVAGIGAAPRLTRTHSSPSLPCYRPARGGPSSFHRNWVPLLLGITERCDSNWKLIPFFSGDVHAPPQWDSCLKAGL
jgi:hypothetical protein